MPTLSQIRDRIKQRTDNEYADGFVTDGEIDQLINLHYKELYELLQRHGLHRVETEYEVTATGAASYALPVDLYAVFAVFRQDADGTRHYLTRHDQRTAPGPHQADGCTYRVVGGLRLQLDPTPTTGTYVVVYIPIPPDMVDDDDTLDGILGWDEFVVLAATVDVMVKESVDPVMINHVTGQLESIRARIKRAARDVEMSEAPCVQDTRVNGRWPVSHRNIRPAGWPWGY